MPWPKRTRVKRKEPPPFVSVAETANGWKPKNSWLIVLRKEGGVKDIRKFSGPYNEAVLRRNDYLKSNSLYISAWLIEERERSNFSKKTKTKGRPSDYDQ